MLMKAHTAFIMVYLNFERLLPSAVAFAFLRLNQLDPFWRWYSLSVPKSITVIERLFHLITEGWEEGLWRRILFKRSRWDVFFYLLLILYYHPFASLVEAKYFFFPSLYICYTSHAWLYICSQHLFVPTDILWSTIYCGTIAQSHF